MTEGRFGKRRSQEELDQLKPVQFWLDGTNLKTREDWSEEFHTVPVMPPGALDDLAGTVSVRKNNRNQNEVHYDKVAVIRFFRAVLVDEDVERFDDLVRDKDRALEFEYLLEALAYVSEKMGGVPTQVPSA